tara:strand:- start:176 stop:514 length:339 start_codon:yes stop_codon:yes gene_type:complete
MVERLQHELRADDWLVRLGGEEFAVLARNMQDDQAIVLAERLRRSVADEPFYVKVLGSKESLPIKMSISLGIARQPENHSDPLGQMMAQADQALYTAKRAGRNRAVSDLATE